LVQAACEILRIDREQVSDSTSFAEYIGADSLDIVELVMKVEEGFGVSMPDGELERIRTLRDAIEYLARHAF
jgi:acyl carrier protein